METHAGIHKQPCPQVLLSGEATAGLGELSGGKQPSTSGVMMMPTVRPFASPAPRQHQETGDAIQQQPYPQVLFRSEATAGLGRLSSGKQPSRSGAMTMHTVKGFGATGGEHASLAQPSGSALFPVQQSVPDENVVEKII